MASFSHHFPPVQPSFPIFSHMFHVEVSKPKELHLSTWCSEVSVHSSTLHATASASAPCPLSNMAGKSPKIEVFCWENHEVENVLMNFPASHIFWWHLEGSCSQSLMMKPFVHHVLQCFASLRPGLSTMILAVPPEASWNHMRIRAPLDLSIRGSWEIFRAYWGSMLVYVPEISHTFHVQSPEDS